MFKIIPFILLISISEGLIEYDCGSRHMNVTTLSLIDVANCDIPEETINITKKYIQLLQLNEFTETTVTQCKLEVHRTVYYCGHNSHISVVQNGETEYISEISQQACELAHNYGVIKFNKKHIIQGLRVNHTSTHSMTFAGSLKLDGGCNGESFSDPYGSWDYAVVQGTLKVTLSSHTARVDLSNNKVHLGSGVVCILSNGNCLDNQGGYTFWRPVPQDKCKFNQYGVLFEGYADKMIDLRVDNLQTIYSLTTDDITFALAAKSHENVCGYSVIQTEHPKLFIFETVRGESFALREQVSVNNLDIFTYVNSKFVYVEKHVRTQMQQLYRDVIIQRCNLERQTLKNSLSIATQAPDEFAYNLMKGPGYMAVLAGEVVHIVKCIPVEVVVEHGEECYSELQVSRRNATFFLTPRTHILKIKGTKVDCNALLPAYYQIGESWYKILPRPTESIAPLTIKPLTKPTWKYISPSNLATSGIYTEKDLSKLRDRIMFPVEQHALLNDVAREINGQVLTDDEGTLSKLLNPDAITKIANSAWNQIWNRFMTFGTISAGFLAIITIFHAIRSLANILIRGYTLHSIFGWSFYLLGAIWSSLSYFFIVKHSHRTNPSPTDIEASVCLKKEEINQPDNLEQHQQQPKEKPLTIEIK